MSLWEDLQDFGSSTWDTVQGGLESWVGIEVNEELDRLGDSSGLPSSDPGNGNLTTGSAPPSDNLAGTGAYTYTTQGGGGGGMSLQTVSALAGIAAAGILIYQFARG